MARRTTPVALKPRWTGRTANFGHSATSGLQGCASAQLISAAVRFQDLAAVGPRSTDPCHTSKPSSTGCTASCGQVYPHRCSSAQLFTVAVCFQDATVAGSPSTESSHSRRTRRTGRTENTGQVYLRGCPSAQLIPASAFPRRSNCWQAPSRLLPLLKASKVQPNYLITPNQTTRLALSKNTSTGIPKRSESAHMCRTFSWRLPASTSENN